MSERARVDSQNGDARPGGFIPAPLARLQGADDDLARLVVVEEDVQHFARQMPRDNSEHTVPMRLRFPKSQTTEPEPGSGVFFASASWSPLPRSGNDSRPRPRRKQSF